MNRRKGLGILNVLVTLISFCLTSPARADVIGDMLDEMSVQVGDPVVFNRIVGGNHVMIVRLNGETMVSLNRMIVTNYTIFSIDAAGNLFVQTSDPAGYNATRVTLDSTNATLLLAAKCNCFGIAPAGTQKKLCLAAQCTAGTNCVLRGPPNSAINCRWSAGVPTR